MITITALEERASYMSLEEKLEFYENVLYEITKANDLLSDFINIKIGLIKKIIEEEK